MLGTEKGPVIPILAEATAIAPGKFPMAPQPLRRLAAIIMACGLLLLPAACGLRPPAEWPGGYSESGLASYYAHQLHGKPTASGEPYDPQAFTGAHRTLPFGTRVEVLRPGTGRAVTIRINDRGPFVKGRIIDLSYAAARQLGMLREGVVKVQVRVVN
jgi:rare lipoprotein A